MVPTNRKANISLKVNSQDQLDCHEPHIAVVYYTSFFGSSLRLWISLKLLFENLKVFN